VVAGRFPTDCTRAVALAPVRDVTPELTDNRCERRVRTTDGPATVRPIAFVVTTDCRVLSPPVCLAGDTNAGCRFVLDGREPLAVRSTVRAVAPVVRPAPAGAAGRMVVPPRETPGAIVSRATEAIGAE
jgi:hypothetical protein